MFCMSDIFERPKKENIYFSKIEIESCILKFKIGFLKSENKRLKKALKKMSKINDINK